MNYRHAYHAGNFADCFKHALLVELIESLNRKAAPYFVLDTHAGAGRYDLADGAALRTAEANSGIMRLLRKPAPSLGRYLGLVERLGVYPGSPVLINALLRGSDRLACCELHPVDNAALKRLFHRHPQIEVHERSGWEALGALLPPREKRGLVFIDPPFEQPDEFRILTDGLRLGHRRFGHGVFATWYPVKRMAPVRQFHADMTASGIRDVIALELRLRDPVDPDRLNGCGFAVINPPYQFEARGLEIATEVLQGLGDREPGAGVRLARLADE